MYYRHIAAACAPGSTLGLGAGAGYSREYIPDLVSTDLLAAPCLNVPCYAQSLPFRDASFANIVLLDVLHHEPVDLGVDPLDETMTASQDDPFDSNQAIASLLFGRHRQRLAKTVSEFEIVTLRRFSFFAYPLSGGFKAWSLLPASAVRPLLKIEDMLEPWLGPVMAFRLLAVLERQ